MEYGLPLEELTRSIELTRFIVRGSQDSVCNADHSIAKPDQMVDPSHGCEIPGHRCIDQ